MGLWFEELVPGLEIEHQIRRTVTETDNTLFSTLTMNPQPLHLDEEFAKESEFGTRVVNGLFTLSLVIGLSVTDISLGTTIANLGYEVVEMPAPVFHGDTIRVTSTVLEARESRSRPTQGIVKLEHRGLNQRGELVSRVVRSALFHKRPAA
ncbi:MaoC family dehydratase [Nonomuraea sp. NPDC048916]|uniref:MaoC family dehydratase n=1 Tax=Nonomuraea sp. NPDC048916 TaxID=3154232 RepID=UPI0033FDC272